METLLINAQLRRWETRMSDPKVQRVLRVQHKESGMFVEYDLDTHDLFFFALNEDGSAYTPPLDQPTIMVSPL